MTDFDIVRDAIHKTDPYTLPSDAYEEALAALDRIEAENERLRKALDRIVDGYYDPTPPWAMARQMMELARTALKEER